MHHQLHAPCRTPKSQLNPSRRCVLRYWSAVICFPGVGGGREGRLASGVSEARFPLWPGKSHATLINEHHDYRITPSALAHTTAIHIKPSNTFGSCSFLPAVMYLMAVNEHSYSACCVVRKIQWPAAPVGLLAHVAFFVYKVVWILSRAIFPVIMKQQCIATHLHIYILHCNLASALNFLPHASRERGGHWFA